MHYHFRMQPYALFGRLHVYRPLTLKTRKLSVCKEKEIPLSFLFLEHNCIKAHFTRGKLLVDSLLNYRDLCL
jgi:hypothetical protein